MMFLLVSTVWPGYGDCFARQVKTTHGDNKSRLTKKCGAALTSLCSNARRQPFMMHNLGIRRRKVGQTTPGQVPQD